MNHETIDHEVRDATEPDPGTVDRLVRQALAHERRRSPVMGRVLTLGALLLLVSTVLIVRREPNQVRSRAVAVTNVGDTVVVRPDSGDVWLIGGDGPEAEPLATGTIIVYRAGEGR
jgi:hypothetical protein